MADLKLERIEPWAPHVSAAPLTERDGKTFAAAANGTRTCVGGWQAVFSGVEQGQTLRATWEVDYRALDHPRDTLRCKSYWGEMPPDDATVRTGDIKGWDYLLPEPAGPRSIRFSRTLATPEGVDRLTLRGTFRWATTGDSGWRMPQVRVVETPDVPAAVKVADAVLIPVQPSPYDVWSCADLVDILEARRTVTDGLPHAAFVVSRAITNTKLSNEVSEALVAYGLPVLDARTTQRVAYPTTAAMGGTVFDDPTGPAAREIEAIRGEVEAMLNGTER